MNEAVVSDDTGAYSWCSAKIDQDSTFLQHVVFLVQLYKLECSTGSISLLLGKFVPILVSETVAQVNSRTDHLSKRPLPCCMGS